LSYENVKLWFAKDDLENIVTIDEINDENKNNTFYCPVCGSDLKPKAVKSKQVTSHFAHVDASKCNSESQIHFWFKHKFLEKGDKFTISTNKVNKYTCKDILVEQPYETENGIYKPDVTILTECGNTIYFEMAFTNKKKVKDYLDIWLELKNTVVEVDIKQLIMKDDTTHTFKALFYDGKCFNTKKNDTYYNTIGKYKEEKLNGKVDNELKERIRKLDWFWDELLNYKEKDTSIDEIIEVLEVIEKDDLTIAQEILKKQNCSNIFEEYINVKSVKLSNYINQYLSNQKHEMFKATLEDVIKWGKLQTKIIKLKYIFGFFDSHHDFEIDTLKFNKDSALSFLMNKLKIVNNDFIARQRHVDAKRNPILNKVIDDLRTTYSQFDSAYRIYLNTYYTHKTFVDLDFYRNNKEIYLKDDIIYSKDYNYIFNFLKHEIENIMTGCFHLRLENRINKVLNKLKMMYNRKILRLDIKHVQTGYMSYSKKKKYYIETYFDYSFERKDLIKININVTSNEYKINSASLEFLIFENKLSSIEDDNKETLNIILNTQEDINNMMKYLNEVFVDLIQQVINNYKCTDCSNNLDLNKGQIEFFLSKGFELPKRCKSCRNKRRKNKLTNKEE
jgi:predicted RNA-binding Zn-ribbon protein involved in translation (DUF1610 family)